VQIDRASNTIRFDKCTGKVRLLLNSTLVDLSKPINVVHGSSSFQMLVKPNLRMMVQTLVSRGDKNFIYPAALAIEKKGSSLSAVKLRNAQH